MRIDPGILKASTGTVRLKHLSLEQFRVYPELQLDIPDDGLRVVGPNGSGKTTLVEAIQLLSTTRSRRGVLDADLVNYESGKDLGVPPYCRVTGDVRRDSIEAKIEIYIERDQQRETSKKVIRVADSPRRAMEVVGLLPAVSFTPEDMELVIGSPAIRRRLLDLLLSQVDRQYMRHLSRYQKVLSQRNGLLKQNAGSTPSRAEFEFWDEQLTALGAYVIAARVAAVAALNAAAGRAFSQLSHSAGLVQFHYQSTISQPDKWWEELAGGGVTDQARAQQIGAVFERQLRDQFADDLARKATQIGPHRDDLEIRSDGRLAARFSSRGQQRVIVVALKLAETNYLRDQIEAAPLFILDDVLSELDEEHRHNLVGAVSELGSQMLITVTDEALLRLPQLDSLAFASIPAPGRLEIIST